MLEIIRSKVTATPLTSGWVQIYEFTSDDNDNLKHRGQLFVMVATKKGGSEIDVISSGREIVAKLHDEYFGSQTEKTFDALKNSVQKITHEFVEKWGEIEIVCCSFAGGVVYSAASGGGKVIIMRDGALATILESRDSDVIVASGFPKAGDLILLGTKTFFEKVLMSEVKTGLSSGSPEVAAETFNSRIHGEGNLGTSGAFIIKFQEKNNIFAAPQVEKTETKSIEPKTVTQKFSEFLSGLSSRMPQKGIYLRTKMGDEATSQSRKLTFSVAIVLLVILLVSIGFGIRQKKANDLKKEYQGILTSATDEVNQAISLASVSPDDSRKLFLDSEQKLVQIQALKVKDPKIDELQKKIEDSRAAILGEYVISPTLFLDLGLLSSGFKGDQISFSGGQIFVLDKAGGRIVGIAVDTKKSKVVAGPSVIENPLDLTSYQDNVFVLFSDGIYDVTGGKTKIIDKNWTGDALISSFAGNIYVLDKSGNAIYRYAGIIGGTFGTQQNWLSASTKANFSSAISWGMNGAIYVLYPNARVLKYSLGSPQNFSITGVSPQIGNIDALFADPDNQYIYLLDRAGKRVVVIDKNGKYAAQYIDDQIANATSLVVSEAQKEIILLTGDKLLSIELKNN